MAKKKKPPREKVESGLKAVEKKDVQSASSVGKRQPDTPKEASIANKTIMPESAALPDDVYCPSCGRFVGAYDRCPYCQASMEVRMGLKVVRRIAVCGAIIGLILLWFAARAKKVETVQIGAISVNHNMALVRLEGQVVNVRFNPEKNNFSITINDDTGTMKLGGFDKLKSFQEHFGNDFPQIGDRLEVEGNLSISEQWGASMFLSIPRRLKVLEKFQPDKRTIASLNGDDVGSVIEITADVIGVRMFPPQNPVHRSLELKDASGTIALTLFESDYDKITDASLKKKLTTPGHQFTLQLIVDEYKDRLQLKLRDPANAAFMTFLKTVEVDPASIQKAFTKFQPDKRTIASLNGDDVGSVVEITADVIGVRMFPPNNPVHRSLELKDASGTISLTLFESDYDRIADPDLKTKLTTPGHQFTLQLIVDEYKDRLQLKLRNPANAACMTFIKTVKVEPASSGSTEKWVPKMVSIASVDKSLINKRVIVEGTMESASETEWGVNLQLKDDSGTITVWISKDAAENVMKDPVMFAQGTRLKVTGKVGQYNDILQIKPFKAGDIVIVSGN